MLHKLTIDTQNNIFKLDDTPLHGLTRLKVEINNYDKISVDISLDLGDLNSNILVDGILT